jgi:uncharacterized protein HemY
VSRLVRSDALGLTGGAVGIIDDTPSKGLEMSIVTILLIILLILVILYFARRVI